MTSPQRGDLFPQTTSIASRQREAPASAGHLPDHLAELSQEAWQDQLRSLRGLICELLLKNERLRMKLLSMTMTALEDGSGRN